MNELRLNYASEITRLHREIGGHLGASLPTAVRIGELLVEQKTSLTHGRFGHWIQEHLPFSDRTARNYMALYENRDRLKTETVSDLTDAYRRLRRRQLPANKNNPTVNAAIREKLPDWIPEVGELNFGHYHVQDNEADVILVHNKESAGYVKIYVVTFNDVDEGATIEGSRRGYRIDVVPKILRYLHVEGSAVDWDGRTALAGNGALVNWLYDAIEPLWLARARV